MGKQKTEKPQRDVSKRQLFQMGQQKGIQRIVFMVGSLIIAAVLVMIGVGWYTSMYRPLHQTAIRVNDTEFNMDYYIKMLKFYGQGVPTEYRSVLANEVVTIIEQSEVLRQEALKLGISVDKKEVAEEVKKTGSKDAPEVVRTRLLLNKLRDGYFDQQVPAVAEQRHLLATLLESESQANEIRARLEKGEDFGKLADQFSLIDMSTANFTVKGGDLGWQVKDVLAIRLNSPALGEKAFSLDAGALSQPIFDEEIVKSVGYWLVKILEIGQGGNEEVRVQAMMLTSRDEAQSVKIRLDAGENFAILAKEFSQLNYGDTEAGDMGWVEKGTVTQAFDDFAFHHQAGTLSDPVRDATVMSKGGYWLAKVINIANSKEISKGDRDLLKDKAFHDWFLASWEKAASNIDDSYLDDVRKAWALEKAMGS